MSSDNQEPDVARRHDAVSRTGRVAPKDLGRKTAGGAAIVALSTWIVRLGYVGVYIMLARGLSIEQYGLVAAMTVIINLFGGITTLGLQSALIQKADEPTREEMDLAWTLDCLVTRSLASLAIGLSAFPLAKFFGEPGLELIICVLALEPLIGAFENSSIVVLSRQLNFRRRAWLLVSNGLGFVLGTAAFYLTTGSYWAPVAGALIGRIVRTAVSYVLYPVAPRLRWQWSFVKQHINFASGVFLVALFEKSRGQADKIVVGRLLGIGDMGAYQFVSRLSTQLMREFTKPVRQVLFPTMARLSADQDPSRINNAVYLILEVHVLFGAVLAGGFTAHAATILEVLVGAKWVPHAYVLQAMGCICVPLAINSALYPILRGQGASTLEAAMQGGGLLLLVGVAFMLPPFWGMGGVLLAVACAEFLQAMAAALFLLRRMKLSPRHLLRILVLGLMLGMAPFWGVERAVYWLAHGQPGLMAGVLSGVIGALVFGLLTVLLGRSGVMPGAERIVGLVVQRGRKKLPR